MKYVGEVEGVDKQKCMVEGFGTIWEQGSEVSILKMYGK